MKTITVQMKATFLTDVTVEDGRADTEILEEALEKFTNLTKVFLIKEIQSIEVVHRSW